MNLNESSSEYSSQKASENSLTGSFRTFGESGPLYRVVREVAEQSEVEIEVVASGEKAFVQVERVLLDPIAE